MNIPLQSIDQLYYAVTRITTHQYTDSHSVDPYELKKATGFFYANKQNRLFLVTNRHVVADENKGYLPNIARIRVHVDQYDMTRNECFDLPLYMQAKKIWIEPKVKADLIAIPIETNKLPAGSFIVNLNSVNLLPDNIQLHVAEDVFIMGYPLGVYDDIHNLPITRNGIIASAYPVPWRNELYFLVDSYLEEGVSGSPVMTKFKNSWRTRDGGKPPTGFSFFLLGIISGTFEVPEGKKPTGLNATYFGKLVDHIVDSLTE